jgi:outer membrane protein
VAAAEQSLRAARAELDSLRNKLVLDYRGSILSAREASQRLAVAGRSRESAEESLRITRARYTEGSADVTELLTAQNGLTATRAREESARYDLWTAQSNVERAGGKLGRE